MRESLERKRIDKARKTAAEREAAAQLQEQLQMERVKERRRMQMKQEEYQKVLQDNEKRISRMQAEKAREMEYDKKLQREYEERVEKQERDRYSKYAKIAEQQQKNQASMMEATGLKTERTLAREEKEEMLRIHRNTVKANKEKEEQERLERQRKNDEVRAVLDQQMNSKREAKIARAVEAKKLAMKYKEEHEQALLERQREHAALREKQRKTREALLEQMREQKLAREQQNYLCTRELKYQHQTVPQARRSTQNLREAPSPVVSANPALISTRQLPHGARPVSSSAHLSQREAALMKRISEVTETRAQRVLSSLNP